MQITTHSQAVVPAVITGLIGAVELQVVVDEGRQSGVMLLTTFIVVSMSSAYSNCHFHLLYYLLLFLYSHSHEI